MVQKIIAFELAGDTQELILENGEVYYSENGLKDKIMDFDPNKLLKVVKTIESPTKIISVEEVGEDFEF